MNGTDEDVAERPRWAHWVTIGSLVIVEISGSSMNRAAKASTRRPF